MFFQTYLPLTAIKAAIDAASANVGFDLNAFPDVKTVLYIELVAN